MTNPARSIRGSTVATALGSALLAVLALWPAPRFTTWLQGLYPLNGSASEQAATYALAAAGTWLLSLVALGVWFAPSWIVVRALAPSDSPATAALRCFVIALVLQPVAHGGILLIGGRDLPPSAYRLASLGMQALLIFAAGLLHTRTRREGVPRHGWPGLRRSALLAAATLLVTATLLPRIAWQDLNPDGGELLTMGRSLASHVIARLPTGEIPGVNLGMITIAYPIDWLITTCGLTEAAARLPVIGYVAGIALGIVAISEHEAARALRDGEFALLVLGAVTVCLTLAFNTSYDPYSTDLASPASIDLLTMVFFLATLHFLFAGETGWSLASAVLMSLSRPSALLLCLLTAMSLLLVGRDWRTRPFRIAVSAALATLVVSLLYASVFSAIVGGDVAEGGGNLLSRIRFLRFNDWSRLAWFAVPSGVIPVLTFLRWRRLDARSKVLAIVASGYFLFFYCLAFVSLHHFAPAMLLPLVVLWRSELQRQGSMTAGWRGAILCGLLLAGYAAAPRRLTVYREARSVGSTLAYEIGDYRGDYASMRRAFEGRTILDSLFTSYPLVKDAQQDRVGAPWMFIHYSSLSGATAEAAQYVVRPTERPGPSGMSRVAVAGGAALYVRDTVGWLASRRSPPPPDPRSRWYDVPRTTLFPHLGQMEHVAQVDLRQVADRLLGR